jgi:methionyl-tRNA formyltransferase
VLNVLFMGTPDFAASALKQLHAQPDVSVKLVVSQPDKRSGRGKKVRSTPVHATADALGLPVFQPETLRNAEAIARLRDVEADLFVVAAYGQILRKAVLEIPRLGCVNIHGSLLPAWRGAAPIHRAIAAGDAVSGVSIMRMERGLDTGPVYEMRALMIGDEETAGELHDRLAVLGGSLLIEALPKIVSPDFVPTPQPNSKTTYAAMLGAEDRAIDFDRPASAVVSHINGMSPWPGARTLVDGQTLTFLRARQSTVEAQGSPGEIVVAAAQHGLHIASSDGIVEVLEIKRPGKRVMRASECLNGFTLKPGTRCELIV